VVCVVSSACAGSFWIENMFISDRGGNFSVRTEDSEVIKTLSVAALLPFLCIYDVGLKISAYLDHILGF